MDNYISRLDEIDKWLFDSFGILPGCGCSQENLRHTTARMVAEVLWPKEETHTLLEWQQILAERPELMAEFERMCPPQQIQGSLLENKQNDE